MASFTDNIPQFNPYIQQLPVDAMVKVGMYKQQKYDEGVQKIQTQIDKVAGLDIYKDISKEYLKSKLNELGTNLNTVAAGDFSNFQLVNSVGGMIKQIGNDPIIQNAVISTQYVRKGQKEIEIARKEGKSAVQNEMDFYNNIKQWENDGKLDSQFSGSYSPYVDVNKKYFEVLKTLHSDLREEDIPYEVNSDGSINYQKTAIAMQRVSKEQLSADKIENALRASLTPAELNQLSIDARYTFKDVGVPELSQASLEKYNAQIKDNNERIQDLIGFANLSSSDPKQKKKAEDAITELKNKNIQLKEQFSEEIKEVRANPDAAKISIYKNASISSFAKAHAWEHNKENLLKNPIIEYKQWEVEQNLRERNFNQTVAEFNWKKQAQMIDWDIEKTKIMQKEKELYGAALPFEVYMGASTDVGSSFTAIKGDEIALRQSSRSIIMQMAKDLKASPDQIYSAIERYNSGNPEWYKENGKTIIPVQWRDKVNQVIDNNKKAELKAALIWKADKAVKSRADYGDMDSDDIEDAMNEEIMKLTSQYIPRVTTIAFGSGEGNIARRTWEGIVTSVLMKYDKDVSGQAGGSEELRKKDVSQVREWIGGKEKDDIIYKKLTQGDKTFLLLVKGTEEKLIPLNPEEAAQLPISDPNQPSSLYMDIAQTQAAFDGTTNPTGKFENSYFGRSYFVNTSFNVRADLVSDKSNSSKQYIQLKLATPIGVLPLLIEKPVTRDQAIAFTSGLTNEKIKQLYLENPSNLDLPTDWKNVIKNLK